ncbi:MAG: glycoside hydrolase family 28 protein, partial [Massilia sp.]|nr:glycoside hydrolase family 28 protein [Massilia sp.]
DDAGLVATPAPGAYDCYMAIATAIAECSRAGGGRVVIPAGNWLVKGPIVLRSHVNVHLAAGAHVFFSNDPADFAKYGDIDCGPNGKLVVSRWQSNDCLNYSPMVYAFEQHNIALTGEDWTSILDGQGGVPFSGTGDCWWDWKGKRKSGTQSQVGFNPANPASIRTLAPELTEQQARMIEGSGERWRMDENFLPALAEAGVPLARRVFGIGHYLRPCMIEFIGCTDVLMQGYQVNQAPFWQHHPVHCRHVEINHVHMDSMGPNSDGFDPDACNLVLVRNCTFNTGDDCIAIKSGKNRDTQFGPTRDVLIEDCVMNSGHGGITLGSEMSGGIEHVYAQRIEFRNVNWATSPLSTAIRLKSNMNRGGYLRHLYVRDVQLPNGVQTTPGWLSPLPGSPIAPKSVAASGGAIVTIDCAYAAAGDNVRTRAPQVSDVHISGVKAGNAGNGKGNYSCYQAMVILGPVAFDYNGADPASVVPVNGVSISDSDFGTPSNAAQPWYLYNVRGLTLRNVTIAGTVHNRSLSA